MSVLRISLFLFLYRYLFHGVNPHQDKTTTFRLFLGAFFIVNYPLRLARP
jgi:hypothetical protein